MSTPNIPILTNIKVTMYLTVSADSQTTAIANTKELIQNHTFCGAESVTTEAGIIITNEFTAYEITNQGS